jgi:hypothetical protein
MTLEPTIRTDPRTGRQVYLYSPQQLEAMVHPADRLPPKKAGSNGVMGSTTGYKISSRLVSQLGREVN